MTISAARHHPHVDDPAGTTRVRRWTARRPLAAFLVLTFLQAYTLVAVVYLAYRGTIPGRVLLDQLPIAIDEFVGAVTILSLFPAALYVTLAAEGRPGVGRLLRRATRWRVRLRWWLLVLFAIPVLTTGMALVSGDTLRNLDLVDVFVSQVALLAVNFIVINLWEEIAWAGVFQTRLERRHNVFVAAVLTAVPFAFLHLPLNLFLGPVTPASLLFGWLGYLVLGILFRPMIGVFLRGTGDSLLLVALLHSVFNRTNNENGIAATLLDGNARGLTMLLAVLLLTGATAVTIRRRLTRAHRRQLDHPSAPTTDHRNR